MKSSRFQSAVLGMRAHRRTARSLHAAVDSLERRQLFAGIGMGDRLEYPLIFLDGLGGSGGTSSYDAGTSQLTIQTQAAELETSVGEIAFTPPADINIQARIDATGNFLGGVAGDDLIITQDMDGPGGAPATVLLSADLDAPGSEFGVDLATSTIEFTARPTGGTLSPTYFTVPGDPHYVGAQVRIGNDPLSFASSFGPLGIKGFLGAVDAPPGGVESPLASLSGHVYADCENDGIRQANNPGIAGVSVSIYDAAGALVQTVLTDANGKYAFVDLPAGTYTVVENAGGPLTAYLDGKESVGSGTATPGTTPTNDTFAVTLDAGESATEYNFGEVKPASLGGFVWLDLNDDGTIDFGEDTIQGVTVKLYRQNGTSWTLVATDVTDLNGLYQFENLMPGTYKVVESQPSGYADGKDALGTVTAGSAGVALNDVFCDVRLECGAIGQNYNFGERPPAGCTVRTGQTATIGFWNNKNGQALLRSLNGGPTATNLGNWLAEAFPNLYGNSVVNFAGKTNDQIARYFQTNLFSVKSQQKVDAQVLAVAFAVYVTTSDLAGSAAGRYGFRVSEFGVGASTFNVRSNGAAFGVANNSNVRVIDLLIAVDRRSWNGRLYDANHNGITESLEQTYRNMANIVFSGINEQGDIV